MIWRCCVTTVYLSPGRSRSIWSTYQLTWFLPAWRECTALQVVNQTLLWAVPVQLLLQRREKLAVNLIPSTSESELILWRIYEYLLLYIFVHWFFYHERVSFTNLSIYLYALHVYISMYVLKCSKMNMVLGKLDLQIYFIH